jgi:xanthine dehydrogenase accessory factor
MSEKQIYEEIARVHQTGGSAALVTVVATSGSTPRKAGAKMLVFPDGRTIGTIGGGCIDRRVYSEVARVFAEGHPRLCRYELDGEVAAEMGMICGGRMEVFVERIDAEPRVVLFGGGHVGKTLAHLCALVGFKVTVVDDREEFARPDRFPDAHEVICEDFSRAGERVARYGAPFVVAITRGHSHDQEVLEQVLRERIRYVGLLGSKHKISALFHSLVRAGFSEERIAEIHTPVGLDLGAQTPEEIALAICAELVAVRYGRSGGPLCEATNPPRGRPLPEEEKVTAAAAAGTGTAAAGTAAAAAGTAAAAAAGTAAAAAGTGTAAAGTAAAARDPERVAPCGSAACAAPEDEER